MQLNHDDIQEFKEIYRQEFGEELSDEEAHEMASSVMRIYELLARQLPADMPAALETSGPRDKLNSVDVNCDVLKQDAPPPKAERLP